MKFCHIWSVSCHEEVLQMISLQNAHKNAHLSMWEYLFWELFQAAQQETFKLLPILLLFKVLKVMKMNDFAF